MTRRQRRVLVRDDDYWALREDPDPSVPVADLSEETAKPPRRRRVRSRRIAAAVLAVALATAGLVVFAHVANNDDHTRDRVDTGDHRAAKTNGDDRARIAVQSALSTTTASGSFHIRYTLTAAPGTQTTPTPAGSCGVSYSSTGALVVPQPAVVCANSGPPTDVTISGEGVVHVNPSAMVTTANVPGLGVITTRVDGNDVWEDGGANYGMTPSTNTGPGSPLSQFASLVSGTLGRREGAIAMNSLASPTGYLDFAKAAITDASARGDSAVDGVPVHQYEVTIDTMRALDRTDLTTEEVAATTAALAVLRQEGYTTTSVQLSIDGLGFIRRAVTVVHFADGGTVTGDTTFSEFGCATVQILPNGPSILANPSGCAASAPAGPSTSTSIISPPATVVSPASIGTAPSIGPAPTTVVSSTIATVPSAGGTATTSAPDPPSTSSPVYAPTTATAASTAVASSP